MDGQWVLRRAVQKDLPQMRALALGIAAAPHWSESVWNSILQQDSVRFCAVAECSGEVLGFVVSAMVDGVAELESVVVETMSRRRGIGMALCRSAMDWARAKGASSIELEVRESSHGARAMYASLQFSQQGRRRSYYREPTEDAILMRAVL
jgi:ribosomal-protein-alanine N-acetyltransferase